jgi:hypothetical protein
MNSAACNKALALTPEQAKLIQQLVNITPKLVKNARRLALPIEPEWLDEGKEETCVGGAR